MRGVGPQVLRLSCLMTRNAASTRHVDLGFAGGAKSITSVEVLFWDGGGERAAMASKGKILVLDDSQPILDVVRERLEKAGYEVATALTVQKACESVRDCQVAIIDYHMPGITGTEAMRMLRLASAAANNTCRFYLYTTDPSKSAEYVAEGFDGVYTMKGNTEALERQLEATMRVVRLTQATRAGGRPR